jgi:hypothetical protein
MMLQKPLKHPGADVPFIMSSMGPLSLDTLAQGGIRPPMMAQEPAKGLIDSLLSLQSSIREELSRRGFNFEYRDAD